MEKLQTWLFTDKKRNRILNCIFWRSVWSIYLKSRKAHRLLLFCTRKNSHATATWWLSRCQHFCYSCTMNKHVKQRWRKKGKTKQKTEWAYGGRGRMRAKSHFKNPRQKVAHLLFDRNMVEGVVVVVGGGRICFNTTACHVKFLLVTKCFVLHQWRRDADSGI